jgi:hypothetical protein
LRQDLRDHGSVYRSVVRSVARGAQRRHRSTRVRRGRASRRGEGRGTTTFAPHLGAAAARGQQEFLALARPDDGGRRWDGPRGLCAACRTAHTRSRGVRRGGAHRAAAQRHLQEAQSLSRAEHSAAEARAGARAAASHTRAGAECRDQAQQHAREPPPPLPRASSVCRGHAGTSGHGPRGWEWRYFIVASLDGATRGGRLGDHGLRVVAGQLDQHI